MALIIASGYPSTYGTAEAEIKLADEKKWFPTTIDFKATASGSGGAAEAATFSKVIDLIAAEKVGSIQELGLVGHANQETFSMAGKVTTYPADVVFAKGGMIHPESIKDNLAAITKVRDRFAKDGKIILYACHAGAGDQLMKALGQAFDVCVYGFAQEIVWCFTHTEKKILSRGRTYYDANGLRIYPSCDGDSFTSNVRAWSPDKKSCP